jgi:tRNA pseudouridine38-40 synthase
VQGELEGALARILPEPVALIVAGRTDAGVHAWAQVASFTTDVAIPDRLAWRLNAVLPGDVSVLAAEPAPDGFDARRSARSRTYCYRVLASQAPSPFERGRALWHPAALERDALDACAAAVVGTHDFTAFTPTDTEHVRFERKVHRCEWKSEPFEWKSEPSADPIVPGGEAEETIGTLVSAIGSAGRTGTVLCLWIEADAFMRHMVRVLVGTMLEVGTGRRSLEDFASLLDGAPRDRAGETAPPDGLYLAGISY